MIIYDTGQLFDFRWDGEQTHMVSLNTQEKHIWSSATLYEKSVQQKRKQWLADWLVDRSDFSRAAILDFHKKGGEGNPSIDFMMNRYNYLVQTVSITQVEKKEDTCNMHYHDLITNTLATESVNSS